MVSIREVRRMCKEETERGITAEAVDEIAKRATMLARGLIRLAVYEANKKSPRARVTSDNVKLAYLSMMEAEKEEEDEWGDWNEDVDRDD